LSPEENDTEESQLRQLVEELDAAEVQSLNEEGPIQKRLHLAIVALCQAAGIGNTWDSLESWDLTQGRREGL
jgi:hypothetical protein